jgi:hypothetical protein
MPEVALRRRATFLLRLRTAARGDGAPRSDDHLVVGVRDRTDAPTGDDPEQGAHS